MTLAWFKNCVIASRAKREANPDANPVVAGIKNPTGATSRIIDTKLYVPVITLSAQNDSKSLEQLKSSFKNTIKWNKYRS